MFSDGEDDHFGSSPKQQETKSDSKPNVGAPKSSLFSDEEEDLFSTKSESSKIDTEKSRKPVGGVSMFGGVDLFAGKKPSFSEADNKETKQAAKPGK